MPKILSESHAAPLLSATYYKDKGYSLKVTSSFYLKDADLTITYHLYKNETDGCLTMASDDKCIANITFTIPKQTDLFSNYVQINSAFIQEDYRRLSIGPVAYLNLLNTYNIVSDTEQTEAGVHLWRSKIARLPELDIYVVKDFDTASPSLIKDEAGNPVLYRFDKDGNNPLDPQIWGYEHPDPRMISTVIAPEIDASMDETREDVVLLAKKK